MKLLNIITVIKDDFKGFSATMSSTRKIRENYNVDQIIIDSSNEENKKEVEKLCKTEINANYYWQEPKGISAAFNYGINVSNANWLWFINGGDLVNENMCFDCFIKYLEQTGSDAVVFDTAEFKSGYFKKPPMWSLWPPVSSWIAHPSTIVKTELFKKFGYFDENYKIAMDYELWLRFFSKNINVDLVSIVIALFNREGISYQLNKTTRKEVARIIRKYFWTIVKKELWSLRVIVKSIIINSGLINYTKDSNSSTLPK